MGIEHVFVLIIIALYAYRAEGKVAIFGGQISVLKADITMF